MNRRGFIKSCAVVIGASAIPISLVAGAPIRKKLYNIKAVQYGWDWPKKQIEFKTDAIKDLVVGDTIRVKHDDNKDIWEYNFRVESIREERI